MTFDEFKVLAKGMKAVYTQSWFLPDAEALKIWYELLKDLDYAVTNIAIQKYMLTNKKEPTVADIRELVVSVKVGEKPSWSDGWEEVLRAISMYGMYREAEALLSMTELTRKVVKRLGFKNICISENIMTDRANFRMIFEQLADREQTEKQIPFTLSTLIEQAREHERLALEDGEVQSNDSTRLFGTNKNS